jgi:hypothetical protein
VEVAMETTALTRDTAKAMCTDGLRFEDIIAATERFDLCATSQEVSAAKKQLPPNHPAHDRADARFKELILKESAVASTAMQAAATERRTYEQQCENRKQELLARINDATTFRDVYALTREATDFRQSTEPLIAALRKLIPLHCDTTIAPASFSFALALRCECPELTALALAKWIELEDHIVSICNALAKCEDGTALGAQAKEKLDELVLAETQKPHALPAWKQLFEQTHRWSDWAACHIARAWEEDSMTMINSTTISAALATLEKTLSPSYKIQLLFFDRIRALCKAELSAATRSIDAWRIFMRIPRFACEAPAAWDKFEQLFETELTGLKTADEAAALLSEFHDHSPSDKREKIVDKWLELCSTATDCLKLLKMLRADIAHTSSHKHVPHATTKWQSLVATDQEATEYWDYCYHGPNADATRAICKIATGAKLLRRIIAYARYDPKMQDIYHEAICKLIAITPEPTATAA